jgi:hypothetical protein
MLIIRALSSNVFMDPEINGLVLYCQLSGGPEGAVLNGVPLQGGTVDSNHDWTYSGTAVVTLSGRGSAPQSGNTIKCWVGELSGKVAIASSSYTLP